MSDPLDVTDVSRRELLKLAGFLGTWVAAPSLVANASVLPLASLERQRVDTDVLVIGGGIAGVFAALRAAEAGLSVTLLDKGSVGASGMSPFASEIADCIADRTSSQQVLQRIARDCEFLNDRRWAELHLRHAPEVLQVMRDWGLLRVPSALRGSIFLEHLRRTHVRLIERRMVTALLKDSVGRVAGAVAFAFDDSHAAARALIVNARVVISCMGAGALRGPGAPIWGLSHDGDAIAYAAGARITGKEFTDLHPAFDCAALIDASLSRSKDPKTLLDDPFRSSSPSRSNADLAQYFTALRGEADVRADMTKLSDAGASLGLGCHQGEGVVSSSGTGAADGLPGLFVAGDALGSMLMGPVTPYRGVSLLACAVQGDLVGRNAAVEAATVPRAQPLAASVDSALNATWAPRERAQGYRPGWVRQVLQNTVMPFFVSYIKEERRLQSALTQVIYLRAHCVPRLIAADGHELRLAHELSHMLLNQEMKLRAALMRRESRGSHYREDFPARDDVDWLCWIDIFRDVDGSMRLEKRGVPEAWHPQGPYLERYPKRFPGEMEFIAGSARFAGNTGERSEAIA